MNIDSILKTSFSKAFKELFDYKIEPADIKLQPTNREFEGSHTFIVFPYLKITKKRPEETAELLGSFLKGSSGIVSSYNVVKGFLNLVINDKTWLESFEFDYITPSWKQIEANRQKVMVEYSSPNTNKPLHLGHLRNNFLGYSVSEILKATGNDVEKVTLVNDRGIHICKSMVAYKNFGNGESPDTSGIKGDHLVGKYYVKFDQEYKKQIEQMVREGMAREDASKNAPLMLEAQDYLIKWEKKDPEVIELWKKMNGWVYDGFNATYKTIGVDFDKTYYESETYILGRDIVAEGLEKGLFYKKPDGSVWVDLSDEGLDEKLLLRSDGTSVYMTQDLGTADLKYRESGFDQSVYVVGNEQNYHFDVLFMILRKLGRPYADGLYHLSYGMVDLPSGKMKSREGTVVDADDLVEEMVETARIKTAELGKIDDFSEKEAEQLYKVLALGALKYFLLKIDPKKRMMFNPEESIQFQGHTGPFIQYTHARISAILRKALELNIDPDQSHVNLEWDLHETERDLIATLNEYRKDMTEASENFAPSIIANYCFELAKNYNRFYTEVSIFKENNVDRRNFRVSLSSLTARTIKHGMSLLGIDVPERM
ncbi:MAG: arginine--tRNA ligase [Cyclobacteriaceae bacterium]|jgi:arginyl-tRNA synthetase